MAETDRHRKQMIAILDALEDFFRDDPFVYVTGNIFFYYLDEVGERQSVSPDIMVIRGVPKKDRRYYKLDDEGQAPEVIIELLSRSTKLEDLGSKKVLYAGFGVREYFVFDPLKEVLSTPLRGFRLENGEYVSMVGTRLRSEALGLDLTVENDELRLYDPRTKKRLRTYEESEAAYRDAEFRFIREAGARRFAEAKVEQEAEARHELESEVQRLREELTRSQKQKP